MTTIQISGSNCSKNRATINDCRNTGKRMCDLWENFCCQVEASTWFSCFSPKPIPNRVGIMYIPRFRYLFTLELRMCKIWRKKKRKRRIFLWITWLLCKLSCFGRLSGQQQVHLIFTGVKKRHGQHNFGLGRGHVAGRAYSQRLSRSLCIRFVLTLYTNTKPKT